MDIDKLYAQIGRIDMQIDEYQAEMQRLGKMRGQLVQQIKQAEASVEPEE